MRSISERLFCLGAATFALVSAEVAHAGFAYGDFISTSGMSLLAATTQSGTDLRLTPAQNSQTGAAWFNTPQVVADGFSTTFSFRITEPYGVGVDGRPGADGFAFVIQAVSAKITGTIEGGGIGYDIPRSLAVEFDTWLNPSGEGEDPNSNHISIHTKGTARNDFHEAASIASTGAAELPDMSDGAVHIAKVEYSAGVLTVYLDDLATPRLSVAYDLANIGLNSGAAWVGFTASTGGAGENHDITAWSFKSNSPIWAAGPDLALNEKPDRAEEASAINQTVPQWSYGYRDTAASTALTPFTPEQHFNNAGQPAMDGWDSGPSGVTLIVNTSNTNVIFNFGNGDLRPVFPGQIMMDPAQPGTLPVARWTAPEAGRYNIVARWLDLDPHGGNGVSCHVVKNGAALFNAEIDDGGAIDVPLQGVDLQAGDTIDFCIGSRGGDFSFDLTGFNAAIRRTAAISLTAPTTALESQQIPVSVNVGSSHPVSSVQLRENGRVITRDHEPPFEFSVLLNSGTHTLQAVALDPAGVESPSNAITVNVTHASTTQARASKGGEERTHAAAAGGSYFFTKPSGNWSDPNSWTPAGVPGANDDAFVLGDGTNGSVVRLTSKVEVRSLSVGTGSKIVNESGAPRFEIGIIANSEVWLNDCELRDFELLVASGAKMTTIFDPVFTRMTIVNNGETIFTGPGRAVGDATTELINSGSASTRRAPGSNESSFVALPQIQQNGGQLLVEDITKLATSTLIGNNGNTLIGADGASLVGPDGASIVSRDGAGLIGADGASLVGPDGATLIGPDGASLIGADGASLVGPDGATIAVRASAKDLAQSKAATAPVNVVLNGGVLGGTGNIIGNVVNHGGFVSPGPGAGALRVFGDYTQEENGSLLLEIGGTDPLEYDQLQVLGAANLDGSLIVRSIDNFSSGGVSIAPITYDSVSGNFSHVTNAQLSFNADAMTLQPQGQEPPAPKALNISTRMRVETGDDVLIAGFIITGNSPKRVIIRGLGPSLPVSGALADPTLELDGGALANDDWRDAQEGDISATGIAPTNERESAIVATLDPGAHTAVLRGKDNGTGVGLVEVYDLESGTPVQLANISTRGLVQTGDGVMIGGFIIGGDFPAQVLLRAIAPSLPVAGTLPDPVLELVDANGASVTNDNWRSTQEAEIASILPPNDDREAAVIVTLVPGSYTAVVRGKDDTTGVALVEGYNLQ